MSIQLGRSDCGGEIPEKPSFKAAFKNKEKKRVF